MDTHEVLVRARNLIDREGWTQGGIGGSIDPSDGRCASIAVGHASGNMLYHRPHAAKWESAYRVLANVLGVSDLVAWNDAPGRTKDEVLAAFDAAIAVTAPPPLDFEPSESFEAVEAVV